MISRDDGRRFLDDVGAYIYPLSLEKPIINNSSPMAMSPPHQCFAKCMPK